MEKKVDPRKAMPIDQLYKDIIDKGYMKDLAYIKCDACNKLHPKDSEEFISIYGNIMVGLNGSIVGNNFDEDRRLFRLFYFCRKLECFPKLLFGD